MQGEKSIQKKSFPLQICFPFSTKAPWKKEKQNIQKQKKDYILKKDFNACKTNSQMLHVANKHKLKWD